MANRSGADLELRALIARAGFDPDDPTVYKFGAALLEQLADEFDLANSDNFTVPEITSRFTDSDAAAKAILEAYLWDGSGKLPELRVPDRLSESSLSASFGRTYRPEAYGAVGDGVTDDLPAFAAIANAIKATPDTPARVEVSGVHYVSNSINFDGEHIEVYLAAGSHIFTTGPTSKGHTLGFYGYIDTLFDETEPSRAFVKVHGPGKVTGWLGAAPGTAVNNENAIGIVRFAHVVVDGPQGLVAGNKGVTAQIGIHRAEIRNVHVERANFRGITIEDQGGLPVISLIEDCHIESSGESATFIAGAVVRQRRITVGTAHTNAVAPTSYGAIGVTVGSGGTLVYASVEDSYVENAGQGKGVVISGGAAAVGIGEVSNVRVDAAVGSTSEFYNLTRARERNVTGPTSTAVASGSTPAANVSTEFTKTVADPLYKKLAADTMFIPASAFVATAAGPVIGIAASRIPAFFMDAAGTEQVAAMLPTPLGWATFNIDLLWTNVGAGAGDVKWQSAFGHYADAGSITADTVASTAVTVAAPALSVLKVTRLLTSVAVTPGNFAYTRILRNGADAADTLANDAAILGIRLTRAT